MFILCDKSSMDSKGKATQSVKLNEYHAHDQAPAWDNSLLSSTFTLPAKWEWSSCTRMSLFQDENFI